MSTQVLRETSGEFEVVVLRSSRLEVAVAPGVGAKIIRMCDQRDNREWIWAADPARRLKRNAVGDAFDDSPLIGVDECLPTVAPCVMEGRAWADHGEVWPRAWELDEAALADGRVVTRITLGTVPLAFERTLRITDHTLHMEYHLRNLADRPQRYAWALHPLLALREGDRVELPAAANGCTGRVDSAANLPGLAANQTATWPEPASGVRMDRLLAGAENASLKLYLPSPMSPASSAGAAAGSVVSSGGSASVGALASGAEFAIVNEQDGTRLRGRYGPLKVLPYLGVWATRGGWNGYHHFAVEPTNVNDDRADHIDAAANPAAEIGPGEERRWHVELTFGA